MIRVPKSTEKCEWEGCDWLTFTIDTKRCILHIGKEIYLKGNAGREDNL